MVCDVEYVKKTSDMLSLGYSGNRFALYHSVMSDGSKHNPNQQLICQLSLLNIKSDRSTC